MAPARPSGSSRSWSVDEAAVPSVFGATVFHTTINVSDAVFPVDGSGADPAVNGPILVVVACLVVGARRWRSLRAA
jgi:hypothetical protein